MGPGSSYPRGKICIGKISSDAFRIQNNLKQGDALSPLLFNFVLEYTIKKVKGNQGRFKLNGTHRLLAYAVYRKERHRSSV